MKNTVKRVAVGAMFGGALCLSAGMGVANAQPNNDGQIDVQVGNSGTLRNVPISNAVQIAAGACNIDANQVTGVAETVSANGTQQNVCNNNLGAVAFTQSEPGNAAAPAGLEGPGGVEAPMAPETTTPAAPTTSGSAAPTTMSPSAAPTATPAPAH